MFLVKMAAGGSGSSSGTYATTTTTDGDCTDLSSDRNEEIEKIKAAVRSKHYANVNSIARVISGGNV